MNTQSQIVPAAPMGGAVSTEVLPPTPSIAFGGVGGNAIRTLLRLMLKRRIAVGLTLLAALACGIAYVFVTKPAYRASATLEIAREVAPVIDTNDRRSSGMVYDQEFYETQYGLLRGKALAEDVVRRLGLNNSPQYLGIKEGEGSIADLTADQRMRAAAGKVMGSTSVVPARESRLVDVRIVDGDPQLAAKIANTLADAYIRQNLEKRVQRSAYARSFLDQRIQQVRSQLETSERKLVAYAGREQIINVPTTRDTENGSAATGTAGTSLAGSDLAATSQALVTARAARAEAEGRWNAARDAGAAQQEVLTNPAVTSLLQQRAQLEAEIAQLASGFDNTYPALIAKRAQVAQLNNQIRGIQGSITSSLQSNYQAAAQREASLAGQVNRLKSNIIDLSNRSIQYTILQREVDTNRALYDGLLQQYKQASVASDLGSNNVNFVLRAEAPSSPYTPNTQRAVLISLLLGSIAAVGLVLFLEVLDARISSPEDFRERLEAPLLGVVPTATTPEPLTELLEPRSPMTEAYSSAHAALRFTTPLGAPHVLAITSTSASEGKSTTAIAIASIFARRGENCLIIDADLRRPSLHKRLQLPNDAGFSDLLAGTDLQDVPIHKLQDFPMYAMTSGPLPPNPADLLAHPRLAEMLPVLRSYYDRVIIDAPPVLGLADAPYLAHVADGTLFVVQAGGPRLGPIRRAVERLVEGRARIVGFLFTKYTPRHSMFSEYASYEYYTYGAEKKKLGRSGASA